MVGAALARSPSHAQCKCVCFQRGGVCLPPAPYRNGVDKVSLPHRQPVRRSTAINLRGVTVRLEKT